MSDVALAHPGDHNFCPVIVMLELEEALTRILSALPAPEPELIPLAQSTGRVLAEQILSPLDLPVFDNSAMDGYAVRASDAAAASHDSPVRLQLCGTAAAGRVFDGEVGAGIRASSAARMIRSAEVIAGSK